MIQLRNVTKVYDGIHGVSGINLDIGKGETVSLIGPNGAGKSTLLKIISNSIHDYEGTVKKNGAEKYIVGYMPDHAVLSEKISVWELLCIIDDFKYNGNQRTYIQTMLDRYDLADEKKSRYYTLSLGMKKKILWIIAMMGTPELLVLDEPTTGLDAKSILLLKEDLMAVKKSGSSVIISGHMLDFLSAVCDRHVFLKEGQIVRETEQDNLDDMYRELYL